MFYKQLKRNLVVGIIVVSSLITSSPGLSQIQPNSNKWVVLSKDVSYRKVELNWNSIEFEPNHLSAGFTYKVAKRSGMAFVDCGNNSARVYYALVEGYVYEKQEKLTSTQGISIRHRTEASPMVMLRHSYNAVEETSRSRQPTTTSHVSNLKCKLSIVYHSSSTA